MNDFQKRYQRLRGAKYSIFELDVQGFCDKLLSYKTMKDKEIIDNLLQLDAFMYVNLGSDSLKSEKQETKKKSRIIYRSIKKLDNAFGDQCLIHQDKNI